MHNLKNNSTFAIKKEKNMIWWILGGIWCVGLVWMIYEIKNAPEVPKELEDLF